MMDFCKQVNERTTHIYSNIPLRVKLRAGALYKKQLEQARQDYLNAEKKHVDSISNLTQRLRELEGELDKLNKCDKCDYSDNTTM